MLMVMRRVKDLAIFPYLAQNLARGGGSCMYVICTNITRATVQGGRGGVRRDGEGGREGGREKGGGRDTYIYKLNEDDIHGE